ncbi:hypothetical protein BX666DRAFT_2113761 [Dichotomocladium elegans]|nr:hypothetical protein BX666DRAFT_2113761 [Dichotomocladium elegans]
MTTAAVRVALRVRPLTEKERMCNCAECISFIPGQPQILIGKDHSFTYDHVFDTRTSQHEIYTASVLPLVEKFLDGYIHVDISKCVTQRNLKQYYPLPLCSFNATILAYGQTGSGKTYSMGTAVDGNTDLTDQQGIVPRFIRDLYERLDHKRDKDPNYNAEVLVSFLELYNEDLVDLLSILHHQRKRSGCSISNDITIREDTSGNIYWSGVREEPCKSPKELLGFLAKGSLGRTTGSTDMNAVSSRSHAIFSVILKQQVPDEENDEEQKTIVSKFHFVDLAGSERLKRTNAQGDRAKEGIAINSGLLALGNVISALGDESRRSTHVPYRDSKLTRLLQDSLGGNSQTLMLACVSPSDTNFVETLSTLKYANRARNIKNRVTINQEFGSNGASPAEVVRLRSQIAKLKTELAALRTQPTTSELDGLRNEINLLRARVQSTSDELCEVAAQRDTLLLERSCGGAIATANFESMPIISHYQQTIQGLRNELQDTRERLAFVESTRAPVMQALEIANKTPTASMSTSSRRRGRRARKNKHVTFLRRSKVPPPPLPIAPTNHQDIEDWLQETMSPITDMFQVDLRNEVRESISKARLEIEKGLKVLHNVKNNDLEDDVSLIFNEEMLTDEIDIRRIDPPRDWGHLSTKPDTVNDEFVCDDELANNPDLACIINQVQSDIRVKEELVNQLERCEAEYTDMRRQFEIRFNQITQEMVSIKEERDRALRRSSFGQTFQREKQQIVELKTAYELKTKQLSDMRRKFEQTSSAIQATRNQNESMLRTLRVNVESLKHEKRRMIKRMKEETLRVKEQMLAHEREIQQLRRRQQRDQETRRRLELENKQVQMLLRKRSDEVIVSNDKLQKLVSILKKAVREGGVLDDRQLNKCAEWLQIGYLRRPKRRITKKNPMATLEVRAAKKKDLLDRAVDQFVRGKVSMIEMQQLITRRTELSQKRQELQSERDHLFGVAEYPGQKLAQFDKTMKTYMDEQIESMTSEISYVNARIQALHTDAAHELLDDNEEDEEVIDMDSVREQEKQQQQQQRARKHVTFADEVMGLKDENEEDEWLDMDALEERYSVPVNADPETSHEMALKVIRSLAPEEAEWILEAMITDVSSLRMDEYNQQVKAKQLEKTVHDLQHTLTVMKERAIETAIKSEKRLRRLEQTSRRSSLSGYDSSVADDDSAIDLKMEERFGTIFDQICVSQRHTPMDGSSPKLRPLRPVTLTEKYQQQKQEHLPPTPVTPTRRRDSMSSPDQFLQQLVQVGLMTTAVAEQQKQQQQQQQQPVAAQSLSKSRRVVENPNMMQRRFSDNGSVKLTSNSMQLLGRRRRAFSLQQQQQDGSEDSKGRRRFSLRELSLGNTHFPVADTHVISSHSSNYQPSPLHQEFLLPSPGSSSSRYPRNNVFDRLSTAHTKASEAKRTATPIPF